MVLEKRKRDGGFGPWRATNAPQSSPTASASTPTASSSQVPARTEIDTPPLAKKARTEPIHFSPVTRKATRKTPAAASSSQVPLENAPKPARKTRRKKGEDAPAGTPEKRGAMFKKQCPQNILDRVDRVMTQRFFMVDRKRFEGELKEEFQVLGSTGNVYTVTIQHKPSCDCPDAQKGNHCKHILFIYLKGNAVIPKLFHLLTSGVAVLQVTQASGVWYQKALLTHELEDIFANAPLAPNALAHPRIREAYARATGKSQGPSTPEGAPAGPKKRLPGEDDDCPICYDKMHGVAETTLVFCGECGNAVHKECFGQWKQTSATQHKKLTCIYCRAEWPDAAASGKAGGSGAGARTTGSGYLNISGVAGVSPQRDTTSYYHGPRRGQRYYGYNAYEDD
ncbi:hypothetical protein B0H16DRAFT_1426322 [Mycena metata]|uniref:Uncharacterized protein n=1 Tax=Mycena metata TaxID=1033252 RepID=A0AAD7MVY3_9AGAR|nr:hypothetical protein B0H16DRAFT_1426322 [Mycena metata]